MKLHFLSPLFANDAPQRAIASFDAEQTSSATTSKQGRKKKKNGNRTKRKKVKSNNILFHQPHRMKTLNDQTHITPLEGLLRRDSPETSASIESIVARNGVGGSIPLVDDNTHKYWRMCRFVSRFPPFVVKHLFCDALYCVAHVRPIPVHSRKIRKKKANKREARHAPLPFLRRARIYRG